MELKNKKVLITGGRAGIGKAFIKELVIRGVQDIAVMGRRKEPLKSLKSDLPFVKFLSVQGDVGKAEDLERAVSAVSEQ